jgi:hypothetical protein
MITLQTVPVDMLLNVGTYIQYPSPSYSHNHDIDEIRLAAILNDYEMLERYTEKHTTMEM